jgi:hypothetical protein
MSERAEILFKKLWNREAIHALEGQSEDGDFDCKEWHGPDNTKASIAKAVCGFANATGGVIVVGMSAKSTGANSPDVVIGEKPVSDTEAVKSAVLDIILKQVDPGIKGIQVHTVRDIPKSKSGFVLIYVPELDGPPQRSKADWRFYVRIASGTVPMEYFQIEDMFGRRAHPRLSLILREEGISVRQDRIPYRFFLLGLRNEGRGIARFPSIRFIKAVGLRPASSGLDESGGNALPERPSTLEWTIFQGGIDSVVYPNEDFLITRLVQHGERLGEVGPLTRGDLYIAGSRNGIQWRFKEIAFSCEITCEGMQTVEERAAFGAEDYRQEIY